METLESELQLAQLFKSLASAFARLDRTVDAAKEQQELKDIAQKLQEGKTLIREFEREARIGDEMKPSEIALRKKEFMEQLNEFIEQKKQHAVSAQNRAKLLGPKGGAAAAEKFQHSKYENMSIQQLIDRGKKDINDTDQALTRSNKVVEDTIQIATTTAETLHHQTEQLERTLDNLDEIQFSLKKARQVIRDITRSMATDKCILFLTSMAIIALIIMVVLKVFHIGQSTPSKALKAAAAQIGVQVTGRRMLLADW